MLECSNILSPSLVLIGKTTDESVGKIELIHESLSFLFDFALLLFSFEQLLFKGIDLLVDQTHLLEYNSQFGELFICKGFSGIR